MREEGTPTAESRSDQSRVVWILLASGMLLLTLTAVLAWRVWLADAKNVNARLMAGDGVIDLEIESVDFRHRPDSVYPATSWALATVVITNNSSRRVEITGDLGAALGSLQYWDHANGTLWKSTAIIPVVTPVLDGAPAIRMRAWQSVRLECEFLVMFQESAIQRRQVVPSERYWVAGSAMLLMRVDGSERNIELVGGGPVFVQNPP